MYQKNIVTRWEREDKQKLRNLTTVTVTPLYSSYSFSSVRDIVVDLLSTVPSDALYMRIICVYRMTSVLSIDWIPFHILGIPGSPFVVYHVFIISRTRAMTAEYYIQLENPKARLILVGIWIGLCTLRCYADL